ncbi:MAG: hypothetical protein ACK41F_04350 [Fimbriimonadaceae bacterium]
MIDENDFVPQNEGRVPEEGGDESPMPVWADSYRPRQTPLIAAICEIRGRLPGVRPDDRALLERTADLLRTVWTVAFANFSDRLLTDGPGEAASAEELRAQALQAVRRSDVPRVRVPLYPEERMAIVQLALHARVLGQYSPAIELYALRILAASLCATASDRKRLRELLDANPDA